jgi:FlaA1/EpsC-like NDP-sugar epimerase
VKLTYQTGIATLFQFLLLSFLTLASQIVSVVSTCRKDSGNCIGNLSISIILYLLVAIIFGDIWLLGYAAQSWRSKRLAQLLICVEGFIALVALFSVKLSLSNKNIAETVGSLCFLALAVWIIILAFRLMRSGGKRITGNQQRRRRHTIS